MGIVFSLLRCSDYATATPPLDSPSHGDASVGYIDTALNEDTLAIIFELFVFDNRECMFHRSLRAFVLAAVNRRWRAIALSYSRLWTHAFFEMTATNVPTNPAAWETYFELVSTRSGRHSLLICCALDGELDAGQRRTLAALSRLFHRTSQMVIRYYSPNNEGVALGLLHTSMPLLVSLTLEKRTFITEADPPTAIDDVRRSQPLDAPLLSKLCWNAPGLPALASSVAGNLQYLVITLKFPPRSIWQTLYEAQHVLKELSLTFHVITAIDVPPGEVKLRQLTKLTLAGQAWCILMGGQHRHLALPNVQHLCLIGYPHLFRRILLKVTHTLAELVFCGHWATTRADFKCLSKLNLLREIRLHGKTPGPHYLLRFAWYWPNLGTIAFSNHFMCDWRDIWLFSEARRKRGLPKPSIAFLCTHPMLASKTLELRAFTEVAIQHKCDRGWDDLPCSEVMARCRVR